MSRVKRELPRLLEVAVRHASVGAVSEARKMVWALLRVAPESAECWHAFAAILYRLGNATGAAIAVCRAVELDPTASMSHALKAELWLCAGNGAAAKENLARALARPEKLSPDMHRWAAAMNQRLGKQAAIN